MKSNIDLDKNFFQSNDGVVTICLCVLILCSGLAIGLNQETMTDFSFVTVPSLIGFIAGITGISAINYRAGQTNRQIAVAIDSNKLSIAKDELEMINQIYITACSMFEDACSIKRYYIQNLKRNSYHFSQGNLQQLALLQPVQINDYKKIDIPIHKGSFLFSSSSNVDRNPTNMLYLRMVINNFNGLVDIYSKRNLIAENIHAFVSESNARFVDEETQALTIDIGKVRQKYPNLELDPLTSLTIQMASGADICVMELKLFLDEFRQLANQYLEQYKYLGIKPIGEVSYARLQELEPELFEVSPLANHGSIQGNGMIEELYSHA